MNPTVNRNGKYWVHKTQDKGKKKNKKNTTQKTKKMSYTDPRKTWCKPLWSRRVNCSSLCFAYRSDVFDTTIRKQTEIT